MRGQRTRVSISRRISGTRNAAGEPSEEWLSVKADIMVNLQPLSVTAAATLAQERSGQLLRSSHRIFFDPATDVRVDDRIEDDNENNYVIQHLAQWRSHIATTAGITNRQ